jgi:hypothetical protein
MEISKNWCKKWKESNVKSSLMRLIAFGLSLILLANFSFSLILWLGYVWHVSTTSDQVNLPYLLHSVSTLILFLMSLAAFILLNVKRKTVFLLLVTILLSVSCFVYETQYHECRYLVSPIIVNGAEPYQGIGYRYTYANWLWYEKDIIRSGDFTTEKTFHHFFRNRRKGYLSSSTLIYVPNKDKINNADELSEQN